MATVTKRRSWISRLFRVITRRKDPVAKGPRRDDGGGQGNAGVREPRRPRPNPPAMAAAVEPATESSAPS